MQTPEKELENNQLPELLDSDNKSQPVEEAKGISDYLTNLVQSEDPELAAKSKEITVTDVEE